MAIPNRRTILKNVCATSVSLLLPAEIFAKYGPGLPGKPIQLGVIADLHGGLAVDAEARLDAFLTLMAEIELDAIIQLGDFAFPNQKHQSYADKLNAAHPNVLHVIGNHEFDFGLTRKDCFKAWGIEAAYYRRDLEGLRILVLDGNEKGSPDHAGGYPTYIGQRQQKWLQHELKNAELPILILSHQPLAGWSAIDNAIEIQNLLAQHKDKIALCINGHSHVDSLVQVEGVNYLHNNSASYFWVGGKKRMAYYKDPLFSKITIDPKKSEIVIEGRVTTWREGDNPAAYNYFESVTAPPESIVVPAIRDRRMVAGNEIETLPGTTDHGRSFD